MRQCTSAVAKAGYLYQVVINRNAFCNMSYTNECIFSTRVQQSNQFNYTM